MQIFFGDWHDLFKHHNKPSRGRNLDTHRKSSLLPVAGSPNLAIQSGKLEGLPLSRSLQKYDKLQLMVKGNFNFQAPGALSTFDNHLTLFDSMPSNNWATRRATCFFQPSSQTDIDVSSQLNPFHGRLLHPTLRNSTTKNIMQRSILGFGKFLILDLYSCWWKKNPLSSWGR